jgi:hypothetical protein
MVLINVEKRIETMHTCVLLFVDDEIVDGGREDESIVDAIESFDDGRTRTFVFSFVCT